jgi:uncharacterized protein (TIGR02145 family)
MNKLILIFSLFLALLVLSCGNSSNSKSVPNIESKNIEREQIKVLTDSLNLMRSELENLKNTNSSDSLGNCSVPSDGSYIKSVKIGKHTVMAEDLNVTYFRNGDPIPEAKTNREWEEAARSEYAAFCYTPNGVLYNWYAVSDFRGLAPEGWHIPRNTEWEDIIEFLGGKDAANIKMKTTIGWRENTGTNSSGFSGFPSGGRWEVGDFDDKGFKGNWWCSNEAYYFQLFFRSGCYISTASARGAGMSVRCFKD